PAAAPAWPTCAPVAPLALARAYLMPKPALAGKALVAALLLLAVVACGVGAGLDAATPAGRAGPETNPNPAVARPADERDRAAAPPAPASNRTRRRERVAEATPPPHALATPRSAVAP